MIMIYYLINILLKLARFFKYELCKLGSTLNECCKYQFGCTFNFDNFHSSAEIQYGGCLIKSKF